MGITLPRRLEAAARACVGIALDDFGTGYSSLGYLNRPSSQIEDRRRFVRESSENRETVALIQSIVPGEELPDDGYRRSVETPMISPDEGLAPQIQGYLFGRPMEFERASELVHGIQQRLSA